MLADAMFLGPGGPNAKLIVLLLSGVGLLIGLFWLRRVAGPDPDDEPSFWRYREIDAIRSPRNPRHLPTLGWIATRLTTVVASGVLCFVLLAPALLDGFGGVAVEAPWLWLAAVGLAAAGTVWIFRIAYRGPEHEARPSWRYRDR